MNVAEMEVVSQVPFKLPRMATKIEGHIGRLMLAQERADGHVAKIPKDMGANFGAARLDPNHQVNKAIDLAKLLKGKPPMGREQIAVLLKCSKETAAGRASKAVEMGLIKKVNTGTFQAGKPTLTYQAMEPTALTPPPQISDT
jgi:hypothetical protein